MSRPDAHLQVTDFTPYKIKRGEEYMNEAQREHFKNILKNWRNQLMEEVDRTVHHMQDEASNPPDPADRATLEEEFSIELRTRDRERRLIKKIDSTIELIAKDDYGYCDSCGIEIGIRRLEARPTANKCIDCKTLDEIKEKQLGALTISRTDQQAETPYTGRFAPSPSGPLHAGSLIAALASYLDARAHQGRWLLRIEDLDPPRESPEACQQIIDALEQLELHWDGPILFQSQRLEAYQATLNQLQKLDLIFPCICTRQDIREQDGIYPGTCRQLSIEELSADHQPYAIRCRVDTRYIRYTDALQGQQVQQLSTELGDFIIKRKDGLFAYQLAVVVDDAFQGVNHVVRGIDLLDSTARQIYLQHVLKLPEPAYAHIPIIVNSDGQKLSKQHHARPLDLNQPIQTLHSALQYLQQSPPQSLLKSSVKELLGWAIEHWDMQKMENLRLVSERP